MFRVCVLASGSGGNCTAVWTRRTRLLIDAGIACRRVQRELAKLGLPRVDGILITHAHSDHVGRETRRLANEQEIPVYCNRTTWAAAKRRCEELEELELNSPPLVRFFDGGPFQIGDLGVSAFPVPHASMGYRSGATGPGNPSASR